MKRPLCELLSVIAVVAVELNQANASEDSIGPNGINSLG
jgi:hypothetical protein